MGNLIEEDKYERKFARLLEDLNTNRKDDVKYFQITEKIAYLVGQMIGHIYALQIKECLSKH